MTTALGRGSTSNDPGGPRESYEAEALGAPEDVGLPFFAYGAFRPNQLAFYQIKGLDPQADKAVLDGHHLLVRDGLPLLFAGGEGVHGTLLSFPKCKAREGYELIGAFEPSDQYEWKQVTIDSINAWTCFGRYPDSGLQYAESITEWASIEDPALAFGIPAAHRLARHYLDAGSPQTLPDSHDVNWETFFGLQSAYLLLWSVVERVATFRYGAVAGPSSKVTKLGKDDSVKTAVYELGVPQRLSYRPLYDTRQPGRSPVKIRPDGSCALTYWYQVRSSIAHRGKAGFRDQDLLSDSLIDLHDTVIKVLAQWLPELPSIWQGAVAPLRPCGSDVVRAEWGHS